MFITSYERDIESDLDYAQARYYNKQQGRFTSPDKPFFDQWERNPQSWNLYSYVRNNPLKLVDPTGLSADCPEGKVCIYDESGKIISVEDDTDPIIINTSAKGHKNEQTSPTMNLFGHYPDTPGGAGGGGAGIGGGLGPAIGHGVNTRNKLIQ